MMNELLAGLITGGMFGFLLQKATVIRYDCQLGALRLQDMTIVKFMLSSIFVGMIGIYFLRDLGMIALDVKTTMLGSNIIGGLIFGVGWVILGYCPGTQLGALGEGRWDAIWGILGMLVGGALFAETYSWLKKTVYTWGDYGKITLPEVTRVHQWILIPVIIILGLLLFKWFEQKNL